MASLAKERKRADCEVLLARADSVAFSSARTKSAFVRSGFAFRWSHRRVDVVSGAGIPSWYSRVNAAARASVSSAGTTMPARVSSTIFADSPLTAATTGIPRAIASVSFDGIVLLSGLQSRRWINTASHHS